MDVTPFGFSLSGKIMFSKRRFPTSECMFQYLGPITQHPSLFSAVA
jgi:hypothetical protein